jgi:NTE family protein
VLQRRKDQIHLTFWRIFMGIQINLALQGGGAHGAFTWGVLDRILQDEEIEIAAISGTSAGALNGAALKAGWIESGREGARTSLARLWGDAAKLSDLRLSAWMQPFLPGLQSLNQIAQSLTPVSAQGIAAQLYSPYVWGPAWRNPLEDIVRRMDFTKVCHHEGPRLFVGATSVRTGRIRIFSGTEIAPEALMASACLPSVFQAVEIEGEPYWDGGYLGNPALWPLYEQGGAPDLMLVQLNPTVREELPTHPTEIMNRLNEISFNASLLADLRAINFVKELIADGKVAKGAMKDVLVHMIADDPLMNELTAGSKQLASPYLLFRLKEAGRAAAAAFLKAHRKDIGKRASVDLTTLFG